jgi:hypothetical protein
VARLKEHEWQEVRAEWEVSPQQGLGWLTKAGGGRWDVSVEAIRQRRSKEEWQKRGTLASVAEKAQIAADRAAVSADQSGELGSQLGIQVGTQVAAEDDKKAAERSAIVEDAAVKLRASLLERHRNEWNMARKIAYEAAQSRDFEKAKLAKITTETLRNIQDGERKAWGLDAGDSLGDKVIVIDRG